MGRKPKLLSRAIDGFELRFDQATADRMSRVRRSDTKPEVAVRKLVHGLGKRFRLGNPDLPGSPDLANRSRKWAIFVHGCYWHHHEGCRLATVPKRNTEFWLAKFARNRARDERVEQELVEMGYRVLTVWQCETANEEKLTRRLRSWFLRG